MAFQMNPEAGRQSNYLMAFVGKNVKINRGGPDSIEGKLLAVMSDYLVLLTKDGIIYVNAAHVKSITEGKSTRSAGKADGGRTAGRTAGRSMSYIVAGSFNEVLRRLRQQFVQLNQGGPEKVTGFIAEVGGDTLLLVANRDVIRIPLFHIKTVSLAKQSGGSKNSNNNNNRNNAAGDSERGRSQGGRTQGSRTQGSRTAGNRTQGARSGGQGVQGAQGEHGGRSGGHYGMHGAGDRKSGRKKGR